MNKCIMCGNITKNIELRFAAGSGNAVARFSVALQRMKKDDGADFINCVAFGKTAETINQYLGKGSKILFEGHVQTGSYDNKEGIKVYTTDFIVDRFEFVGGKAGETSTNKANSKSTFEEDMTVVDDGDMPF